MAEQIANSNATLPTFQTIQAHGDTRSSGKRKVEVFQCMFTKDGVNLHRKKKNRKKTVIFWQLGRQKNTVK